MSRVKLTEDELQKLKQEVLREQEAYLCEELGDPGRYFPFLRSKGVLTTRDCDLIRSQPSNEESIGVFISTLNTQRGTNGVSSFDIFLEALKKLRVQAHVARSLLRAFTTRKVKKEKEKAVTVGGSTSADTRAQQSPIVIRTPVQVTSVAVDAPDDSTRNEGTPPACGPDPGTVHDIHPDHGPLPNLPDKKPRVFSPTLPSKDVHPEYGVLPPPPPTSSSSSSSIMQPESSHTQYPEMFETGLRSPHKEQPRSYQHDLSSVHPTQGESHSPRTESKYKANLLQQLTPQPERTPFSELPSGNGMSIEGTGRSLEHQMQILQQENEAFRQTERRLKKENERLRRELDESPKQLEQVNEKLRHVTLSYREQNYDSQRRSTDLDDYAELQEESGKLQKQVAEQASRLASLERERTELKSLVDEYASSNQQLQQENYSLQLSLPANLHSRPHHLPINDRTGLTGVQFPPTTGDISGLTPARSLHVGDNLLKHSIYLQHSPGERASHRHSGSSVEGGNFMSTPLSTSSTSISSHESGIFKALSGNSTQATLV